MYIIKSKVVQKIKYGPFILFGFIDELKILLSLHFLSQGYACITKTEEHKISYVNVNYVVRSSCFGKV